MLRAAQNDNQQKLSPPEGHPFSGGFTATRSAALQALKQTIEKIETHGKTSSLKTTPDDIKVGAKPFVLKEKIENLEHGFLHEIWAKTPADHTAAMALALTNLVAADKPFLWITSRALIREHGLPYGPGLKAAGINPNNLLLVQCKTYKDALWALEEGLKNKALAAVVGELEQIDLTASRRLVLTSRAYNSRCLLLMRANCAPSSAAYSRWQVTPETSADQPFDKRAPGNAILNAQLVKHRGGERPALIELEWAYDAPDRLPVAAPLADKSLVTTPTQNGETLRRQTTS